MRIRRSRPQVTRISLVSMIDVLMIMLIFFMVTSSYLDLAMIPMAERADDPVPEESATPGDSAAGGSSTLLIRLGADGLARVQGQVQTPQSLSALLKAKLAADPDGSFVLLPSGNADAQALVTVLDTATQAGVARLRILRLEVPP